MPSISFTELKVYKVQADGSGKIDLKKSIGGIELAMKFAISPVPSYPYYTDIQFEIFDANNQLIYTLVLGSRRYSFGKEGGETVYASIPTITPADLSNIRVEAWITGNTIVRRYDIGTTKGAIEKNRISNIAVRSLSIDLDSVYYDTSTTFPRYMIRTGVAHGTDFDRTRGQQTEPKEEIIISGTKPFEKPERVSVFKTVKDIEEAYEIFPEASAEVQQQLGSMGLSQETQNIIDDWAIKKIIIPSWFVNNNMQWVLEGKISEQEFLAGYQNLVNTGIITYSEEPKPEPEEELIPTPTAVKQTLSKLKIENNTITGRIDFVATNDFPSQLLGTSIASITQVKAKAGFTISPPLSKNISFSKINDSYTIDGILAQNSAITDHNEVIFESFVWKSMNQPLALSTIESQSIKKEEKLLTTSNIEILIYNVEKTKVIGNILTSVSNEDYKRLDDEYSLEDRVKIRVESNSDIKPETDFTSLLIRINELLEILPPPPPPPEPNANMVRQEIGRFQVVNKTLKGKVTYIATDSFDEHFYYNFENNSGYILKCYVIATDNEGNVLLSKQNDLRFSETERDETITINDYVETEENKITVEFYVTNTPTQDSFEDDFAFVRTITTPYFPKKPDTLFGALFGLITIPTALTLLGTKT